MQPDETWVTARDLADAAFCPRVPPLRRWLRRPPRRTPSMWHGRAMHQAAATTARDAPARYGYPRRANVETEVRLRSAVLGLSGQIDLLLVDGACATPVDLKFGEGSADTSDVAQILAYCALVEAATGQRPTEGIVDYRESGRVVRVPFDAAARALIHRLTALTRASLAADALPPVQTRAQRCAVCDVRKLCQAT